MSRPLLPWDAPDDAAHPQLVWRATLDERYLVEVHRITDYSGTLYIFDHVRDDAEISSQEITISYDALFGPNVNDVQLWQNIAINFIDNVYKP